MKTDILCPQDGFKLGNPSGQKFRDVRKTAKKRALGPDKISPHLLQWLPTDLHWDLY